MIIEMFRCLFRCGCLWNGGVVVVLASVLIMVQCIPKGMQSEAVLAGIKAFDQGSTDLIKVHM